MYKSNIFLYLYIFVQDNKGLYPDYIKKSGQNSYNDARFTNCFNTSDKEGLKIPMR